MRTLLCFHCVLSLAVLAVAQELPEPVAGDIAKRGEAHLRLDALAGEWDTVIRVWEGPEHPEALEMKGSTQRSWIFGGKFLEERVEEVASADIQLYEARGRRPETRAGVVHHRNGLFGYDRLTGLYEHIYIHDDSTRMYYEAGRWDPVRNVIELAGTWTIPHNGVLVEARVEIHVESDDRHTVTRYISDENGGEFKDMEVVHTRTR